jgi:hypothetical protein
VVDRVGRVVAVRRVDRAVAVAAGGGVAAKAEAVASASAPNVQL